MLGVILNNIPTIYDATVSINDDVFKYNGRWYLPSSVQNLPMNKMCILETYRVSDTRILQRVTTLGDTVRMFLRSIHSSSATWTNWYKLEGSEVS